MFRIGQQVVCIDDKDWRNPGLIGSPAAPTTPVKGLVYTVRGFSPSDAVYLEEIVCAPYPWNWGIGEGGWLRRRFRPVKETSIDIFTAMLAPKPQHVEA